MAYLSTNTRSIRPYEGLEDAIAAGILIVSNHITTASRYRQLYWTLRAEVKAFVLWFLGSIPLSSGAWLRCRFMPYFFKNFGDNIEMQSGLRVTNPELISIGSNCNFGQGTFITGGGGVRIGDWVGFGPDVKVWSVNHRFDDPDQPWLLQGWEKKAVVIEDDVWLGANVFVMPGVTIGKGAIISACAVVGKSVPAYAIVMGNPGRVVGWRKQPDAPARADSTISNPVSASTE